MGVSTRKSWGLNIPAGIGRAQRFQNACGEGVFGGGWTMWWKCVKIVVVATVAIVGG